MVRAGGAVLIDGWTCTPGKRSRVAEHRDGTAYVYDLELGLTCKSGTPNTLAPPSVMAWLVRPLLAKAWTEGLTAEFEGFGKPRNKNPYEDL